MTIVSNILIGMPAWRNHSFVLGERCQNAGNAYQATLAGTSTAAPTGTGASVNNGGAATFKWLCSVDYTSEQDWWDAIPNPVPDVVMGLLVYTGEVAATARRWTATGKTTTTTNRIILSVFPGDSFADNVNVVAGLAYNYNPNDGVAFRGTATNLNDNYYYINNPNVTLSRIQFKDQNANSLATMVLFDTASDNWQVINCIFDGYAQSDAGASCTAFQGVNGRGIKTLFFDRQPSNGSPQFFSECSGDGSVFTNCIWYGASNSAGIGLLQSGSANIAVVNSITGGYTTSGFQNAFGALTLGYSAVPTANAGVSVTDGGNNLFNTDPSTIFTSAADLRPKAGTPTAGAGQNVPAYAPDGVDLFGRVWGPVWDIGPVRYIAGRTMFTDWPFSAVRNASQRADGLAAVDGRRPQIGSLVAAEEYRGALAGQIAGQMVGSIEWYTSIVSDWAAPAEELDSVARDYAVPSDLGAFQAASAQMSAERLGVASVALDQLGGVEWGRQIWTGVPFVLERLSGTSVYSTVPSSRKASQVGDTALPADMSQPFQQDITVQIERVAIARRDFEVPEAADMLRIRDVVGSSDYPALLGYAAPLGVDTGINARSDMVMPLEFVRSAGVALTIVPNEWLGPQASSVTVSAGLEWRSVQTIDRPSVIETRAPVLGQQASAVAWSIIARADIAASTEASIGVVAAAEAPVATIALLQADRPVLGDINASTLADTAVVVEAGQPALADSAAPGEVLRSRAVDNFLTIDRTLRMTADLVIPLSTAANMQGDYQGSADYRATLSIDTVALIDRVQQTLAVSGDSGALLEFSLTVIQDMSTGSDVIRQRLAIGGRLRPDHWEKENR